MEIILFLILMCCCPKLACALLEFAFVLICGMIVIGVFFMILSQL